MVQRRGAWALGRGRHRMPWEELRLALHDVHRGGRRRRDPHTPSASSATAPRSAAFRRLAPPPPGHFIFLLPCELLPNHCLCGEPRKASQEADVHEGSDPTLSEGPQSCRPGDAPCVSVASPGDPRTRGHLKGHAWSGNSTTAPTGGAHAGCWGPGSNLSRTFLELWACGSG